MPVRQLGVSVAASWLLGRRVVEGASGKHARLSAFRETMTAPLHDLPLVPL